MALVYLARPACWVAATVLLAGCATAPSHFDAGRVWAEQQKPTTTCRLRRNPHCYATNDPANLSILPGVSVVSGARNEPRR